MFSKILIANRGEIACRIIRTAQQMGIATVAVYSDADAGGKHVMMADEARRIGASPSSESYLKGDAVIAAALDTGAEAIHPGFGFLSENAGFVREVEAAGLVFIGPGAEAISMMGDKIASKEIAVKAKVSVVPGTDGEIADIEKGVIIASKIGYPVMVKASAGGGGKGMRIAHGEDELREVITQAQNEALASFGDARVFIEKFITTPRHIEIQVLADSHGNVIFLGERECSLQRRHQKVFEEAPSPFINAKTREAMGNQAVELALSVGYRSAGTVEFIVDADQKFYFLEMNTRLQVEHPVTELVYDCDLVEWMIRIAAGEKLTIKQSEVKAKGWAVEARLYAEDPSRGFLPATGHLSRYREPQGDGIRVDSGAREGGEVSIFYDPMIAKVIGYGKTREAAIDKLAAALDHYVIEGPAHNRQFLRHVCEHKRFRAGDITTAFIDEEYSSGYKPAAPKGKVLAAMRSLAVWLVARRAKILASIAADEAGLDKVFHLEDEAGEITASVDEACSSVTIDDQEYAIEGVFDAQARLFNGQIGGAAFCVQCCGGDGQFDLAVGAYALSVSVLPERLKAFQELMPVRESAAGGGVILSPMPGLLKKVLVSVGDRLEAGADVVIIEAMKMENLLKSDEVGEVVEVLATEGETVAVNQALVRLTPLS